MCCEFVTKKQNNNKDATYCEQCYSLRQLITIMFNSNNFLIIMQAIRYSLETLPFSHFGVSIFTVFIEMNYFTFFHLYKATSQSIYIWSSYSQCFSIVANENPKCKKRYMINGYNTTLTAVTFHVNVLSNTAERSVCVGVNVCAGGVNLKRHLSHSTVIFSCQHVLYLNLWYIGENNCALSAKLNYCNNGWLPGQQVGLDMASQARCWVEVADGAGKTARWQIKWSKMYLEYRCL